MTISTEARERLFLDNCSLHSKAVALTDFISSEYFKSLSDEDQSDLTTQLRHMNNYLLVLNRRITRLCT